MGAEKERWQDGCGTDGGEVMECRGTAGAECAGWLWPARARRRGVVLQGWLPGARNQPLDWMGAVQGLVQTRQRAQTAFAILSLLQVLLPLLAGWLAACLEERLRGDSRVDRVGLEALEGRAQQLEPARGGVVPVEPEARVAGVVVGAVEGLHASLWGGWEGWLCVG